MFLTVAQLIYHELVTLPRELEQYQMFLDGLSTKELAEHLAKEKEAEKKRRDMSWLKWLY